jgi:phosphopantothenoylcysteine decarboxylase/phosphopantothenate--cysteine ligase
MMVLNDITEEGAGFATDTNKVVIVERETETEYPLMSKNEVADMILDRISG